MAQNLVEVKYENSKEGEYTFTCVNNAYCDYYISVNFPVLTGFTTSTSVPVRRPVSRGSTTILKLTVNQNSLPEFNYTYNYLKGRPVSKLELEQPYLLPVKPGNSTETFELKDIKDWVNKSNSTDLYALGFKMKEGDTIYAIRRGTVCELNNRVAEKTGTAIMRTENNSLEIVQEDGTIVKYDIFKENGIFVKLGQEVEAGAPLGIVGGKEYVMGPHLRLTIYYLDKQKLRSDEIVAGKEYYSYVTPFFVTQNAGKLILKPGGTYTSDHPESIVILEMSKKEIAKRNKKKEMASN